MQMRFTLQARTPEDVRWLKVDAPGFGEWITAPAGLRQVHVREDRPGAARAGQLPRGRAVPLARRAREADPQRARGVRHCRQPDSRPDLVLRNVKADPAGYVAVVFNRGREAAGAFDVRFMRDGVLLGSARVAGLEPQTAIDVFLPGPRCAPGTPLEAVVDPLSEVDEANEFNDSVSAFC